MKFNKTHECNVYNDFSMHTSERLYKLLENYDVSYFKIRDLSVVMHLCIACFN